MAVQIAAGGALGWTKVRIIARAASTETEEEWLQFATEKSCRELEHLAIYCIPGEEPPREKAEELEFLEYAWATIRLRTRLGDPDLSASQLLLMLAERELERGDQDDVVAPTRGENAYREQYRIIEHRCPECDRAWTEGRGGRHEMTKETRALVECDAEMVQGDPEHDHAGHVSRTIPPAVRRAVLVRDSGKCQVPGCRNHRHLDLHHIRHRSNGGNHDTANLVTVCSTHHDLLHRDVLGVAQNTDGTLIWNRSGSEPLAMLLRVGRDTVEVEHDYLSEFDGDPGKWNLLDESDEIRRHVSAETGEYPSGSQAFHLGDAGRTGIGFEGTFMPSDCVLWRER